MSFRRRSPHRRPVAISLATAGALAALLAAPIALGSPPSLNALSTELGQQQSHQQQLEASLAGLSQLISSLSGQIALVQSREAAVQSEVAQDRARLDTVEAALAQEESRLAFLRARLARSRTIL